MDQTAIRQMLAGFVGDPPDSEYQRGFLAAILMIAHEVMGVHYTDDLWQQADRLLDDPRYAASQRKQAERKRTPFTVIDGGAR